MRTATLDTRCGPYIISLVCVNKHHLARHRRRQWNMVLCTVCARQCHRRIRSWKMILWLGRFNGSILLFSIVVKCKSFCHSFVFIYENVIHCLPYALAMLCLMPCAGMKNTRIVDTGTHSTQPLGYREIECRFTESVCESDGYNVWTAKCAPAFVTLMKLPLIEKWKFMDGKMTMFVAWLQTRQIALLIRWFAAKWMRHQTS